MSLKGDFDEIKEIWSELSILTKLILVSSFIISSLSLASISDGVFKFRGFINTAIDFYHWLLSPIVIFLNEHTYINVLQVKLDAIILTTLITASVIRADIIYSRYLIKTDVITWFFYISIILIGNEIGARYFIISTVLVSVAVTLFTALHQKYKSSKKWISYRLAMLNVVAIFLFVAIVAAISDGLTRVI